MCCAWRSCAMMAKAAETLNSPPGIVTASNLELDTPFRKRFFAWCNHMFTFIFTVLSCYYGDPAVVGILFASLFPVWLVDLYTELMALKNRGEEVHEATVVRVQGAVENSQQAVRACMRRQHAALLCVALCVVHVCVRVH